MAETPLLDINRLVKHFPVGGGLFSPSKSRVQAVNQVSFHIRRGESFGLVGESGCGKTTLGRLILRLIDPTAGRIVFDGCDITALPPSQMLPIRRHLQMIFQDPYASLDPRMKITDIVTEALRARGRKDRPARRQAAADLLDAVGLKAEDLDKYPHEFSGGQRQRIGIARALCVRPDLIVADEPVSALDVSIQAQVLNLMHDLKDQFGLSYLFISHDLSVVSHLCERIAVMYMGTIVELAPAATFSRSPRHPYTQALLASVPVADPRHPVPPIPLSGNVADPTNPPKGCTFHPRCQYAFAPCSNERPPLLSVGEDHQVACWLNSGSGLPADITVISTSVG